MTINQLSKSIANFNVLRYFLMVSWKMMILGCQEHFATVLLHIILALFEKFGLNISCMFTSFLSWSILISILTTRYKI